MMRFISSVSLAMLLLAAGTAHAVDPKPKPADTPASAAKAASKDVKPAAGTAASKDAATPSRPPAAPVQPPATKAPAPTGLTDEQCIQELRKDNNWRESLQNQLRVIVGVPERQEPEGGHRSVHRATCTARMAKDPAFRNHVRAKELLPDVRTELRESVRYDDHTRDAQRMLRNKRHVLMAYSALWGITVLFVVIMFLRQRRLKEDIERLRNELERAVEQED